LSPKYGSRSHSNRLGSHDDEAIQLIGILAQDIIESLDPGGEVGRSEAEQDHAGMRTAEPDDKIAEVEVAGDQDSLLAVGDGEDILVWQPVWMLPTDAGRIVSEPLEVWDQASILALVEQKSHAEARAASPVALVLERSRSTARCA